MPIARLSGLEDCLLDVRYSISMAHAARAKVRYWESWAVVHCEKEIVGDHRIGSTPAVCRMNKSTG
jgi:hypothetical protein